MALYLRPPATHVLITGYTHGLCIKRSVVGDFYAAGDTGKKYNAILYRIIIGERRLTEQSIQGIYLLDVIKPTIVFVQFGLAALEMTIFAFGTLLVRRDIKQLAGWPLFCAFTFLELCANIELGAVLQSGLSPENRQTELHFYGLLNLASHFLLALFFCQLNRTPSTRFISIFAFVTLLAGVISEYEVAYGGWRDQFMILPIVRQIPEDLICAFSLFELVKRVRREFTFGLGMV